MAYETIHRANAVYQTLGQHLGYVFTKARMILKEQQSRDEIRLLLQLDDRELRDMGISRDDVRSALSAPYHVSSGEFLGRIRRKNR